jgi:hypothetical protein
MDLDDANRGFQPLSDRNSKYVPPIRSRQGVIDRDGER